MGKYLFVMPWGSMELDIEEDEQGLHVVMTSPERNMTVVQMDPGLPVSQTILGIARRIMEPGEGRAAV